MHRPTFLSGAALAAAACAMAVLAASPAQADPDSWSGPNAHCVTAAINPAPDWCSGTDAPASGGYTTTGDEPWPRGSG